MSRLKLLSLLIFIFLCIKGYSQDPPPDPCDCPDGFVNSCIGEPCPRLANNCCVYDPEVPVNGGLKWLVTGGIIIGLFYIYKKSHPK